MKKRTNNLLKHGIIPIFCILLHTGLFSQSSQDSLLKSMNYPVLSFRPDLSGLNKTKILFNKFEPNTLPFFCRIEHKIETGSKIAFRFRIGDLNYVNMLENKR